MEFSLPLVIGAGVLSFLSPCVLPLVPPYLTYMSGASYDQLRAEAVSGSAGKLTARVALTSIFFILGFSVVFIALGATATAFGQVFRQLLPILTPIAGVVIIAMGLHFLGVFRIGILDRQLRHNGITRMVQDMFHETGARPDQLTIELTESLLMEKGGVVERRLRELAEMGIELAIDDFGTGYSSLSYLRNFPVSTLKIDRSFIVDVPSNPDAASITTAIIALAKAMNLEVVAEGVETREQADFLRGKGCEKAQGYLLGRPAPVQMFTEYLRARQRRQAIA